MSLIVLVEDSKPDAEIFKTVIDDLQTNVEFLWFKNGEDCINYFKEGNWVGRKFSDQRKVLMIIDLNLPKVNGMELLEILSKNDDYKKIPKIVYTTSGSAHDIENAYDKGALGYIIKPFDFDEIASKLSCIINYWFGVVTFRDVDIKRELKNEKN